jgi:hypothetical protein
VHGGALADEAVPERAKSENRLLTTGFGMTPYLKNTQEWKHYPDKSDRSQVGQSPPPQVSVCGDRSLKLK